MSKFNPAYKPRCKYPKPQEFLPDNKPIEVIQLDEGNFDPDEYDTSKYRYYLEFDHDYSGCYYPGDDPSIVVQLNVYHKKKTPNPNYGKELKAYEEAKKDTREQVKEWNKLKKQYDLKQEEDKRERELKLLNELKKKYE
jgi:hypothetical protein